MLAIYAIAMIATCWHFSYGLWLFAAKWGITPGDKARKNFGYVCTALGAVLIVIGLASLYAFVGPNYKDAPADLTPAQIEAGPAPAAPASAEAPASQ
jgi:succinate dehydrogenase / fumarate reductase cytochrome b subunit